MKSTIIMGVAGLAAVVGFALWMESGCSERSAYNAVKEAVASQLKSPATADFPDRSEITFKKVGDCSYTVSGYVDAQNSFGATVRSAFDARTAGGKTSGQTVIFADVR